MNKIIRAIILSIFLIWFVINAGYVVSGQADNEEFEKSVSAETAEEWNEKGISFGKSGEYEKAIECFNKAIELEPNYAKAYYYRGIAYGDLKQYEKAICDYNKAIKQDQKYAKTYTKRGIAYAELKEYEKAIEDFNKAIELDPQDAKAHNHRGDAYVHLKQYEKAIEDFDKAIELDPNYAWAYNNRGTAYAHLKQYERAIDDYDKAIELDPNYVSAYKNRGLAYGDLKQYERAIDDYDKAIELDPNYVSAYKNRGLAYGNLKQYEKAMEDFIKAIELDPNDSMAYNYRGITYARLGQYESAIDDYNKAMERNPNIAVIYTNRGNAYKDLGHYERAIDDYNKAIELDPNDSMAYNYRGITYARLGQYERAIKDFEKAKELNQAPEIMEKVVSDQSHDILVESSLNYDINLDDSARTTIFIDIININESTLWLEFLDFRVWDKHSDITNVEVQVPYGQTFLGRKCTSHADWGNRFKNLAPYNYFYLVDEDHGIWAKYFCVAINKTLPPGKVIHYYVSYSIDNFIKYSKIDTKFLTVPYQRFYNVQVSKCKYWFSWDNDPGSDNESLLEILREDLNITWTENATIRRYNNDTIIILSKDEQHSAKIIMDGNRSNATLEISDGNIHYLKIEEVYGKINLYICDTQPTRLKTKDYNVLINLPQDRYHYSKLLTVPHPHPDAIFMNEKSPALSWHFTRNNGNATQLLIPAYKIQKDCLMIALDTFVLLALTLGFISVILAVKDDKHKRRGLRYILVVICFVVIGLYIGLTGLWEVYRELLEENLQKLLSS